MNSKNFQKIDKTTNIMRNGNAYKAIDSLSKQSARSMQLQKTLTTCEKLTLTNNVLYIEWDYDRSYSMCQGNNPPANYDVICAISEIECRELWINETGANYLIGLLKIGRKKLFLYDSHMKAYDGEFVSVLDFYVHQSCQRQGHGRKLFDYMLGCEKVVPHEVALDNPTVTLLSFMAKHYNLTIPVWQNTSFVVFEQLFHSIPEEIDEKIPEGWRRPEARHIGVGSVTNRIREQQHETKRKAVAAEQSLTDKAWSPAENESSAANRSYQARQRKAHLLSSKPLW